jgi:uncharacterized protein (TIGR00251 family)
MVRITIVVSPGARHSEVVGPHGEGWKVRVAAAPERGRANAALVALLGETLGVPRERVRVVAGLGSRTKVVEIDGLARAEIERRLGA